MTEPHQRPEIKTALADAVQALVNLLDAIDGDPDMEQDDIGEVDDPPEHDDFGEEDYRPLKRL